MAAASVVEYESLTGPQKAAIVLLALDQDRVSTLFGMMDIDEIKELSSTSRSIAVYKELKKRTPAEAVLIHSRFRPRDRAAGLEKLLAMACTPDWDAIL